MYRTYLSTLALGLILAVLVAALPATNDKRQGDIDRLLDGIDHIPDEVMSDSYIETAKGLGQGTVITPSSSSFATPSSTPASSSTPMHSSATPTPTAGAQHGAESPSPASATGEPSKATAAPKPSKTTSDKEQINPLDILKPIGKLLGM